MSKHIPYSQRPQPYHAAVAALTAGAVPTGGRVLDAGCGVGHTLALLARQRPDLCLVGADIDRRCLELTAGRVPAAEVVHLSDVADLYGVGGDLDGVILCHTLEHLERPVDALRGLHARLRPGGVLVAAVPNPSRPAVILRNLLRRRSVNRGHVCAWDRSHWMNLLEEILGFDVVTYASDFVELPLLGRFAVLRPLEIALARLLPWFSFSHVAVVRRPAGDLPAGEGR